MSRYCNPHQIKGGPSQATEGWKKPTPAQLSYIHNLGYRGIDPPTRLEAANLIVLLKHRQREARNTNMM